MPKLFKESEVKKWKELHEKGFSIIEIAKKYHVFGGTITKNIKEYEAKLAAKETAKSGTVGEESKSPAGEEASQEEEFSSVIPWSKKQTQKDKKKSEGDKVAQPTGRLDEDERIEAKKSLRFDPDMLKIAEATVAHGVAKDLSDAIRVWGKDFYHRHEELLGEDGLTAPKIKKNETDLEGKDIDFADLLRLMKQRIAMKTMTTLDEGGGGINLDKIIALSFLEKQQNRGDGNSGLNPQIQALQTELKSLRESQIQQAQMQKFEQMFTNLQNQINAAQNKGGGDWKDILALTEKSKSELETIRAAHEQRLEDQRAKTEAARDESNKIRFEHLQDEVKGQMQQASEAYRWKDELSKRYMEQAMTILDDQYKRGAKAVSGEKSTGELAKDFVTDFIGQIKAPILEPMGRALADKMATSQQPVGLSPQQAQVIQDAQVRYKQKQQQLAKEAELTKQGMYDSMD